MKKEMVFTVIRKPAYLIDLQCLARILAPKLANQLNANSIISLTARLVEIIAVALATLSLQSDIDHLTWIKLWAMMDTRSSGEATFSTGTN